MFRIFNPSVIIIQTGAVKKSSQQIFVSKKKLKKSAQNLN
jgi:hypothetical protein